METLSIQEFYKDRCVLITGATGFMGKVLLEKLLRCVLSLERIYILIRPKGTQNAATRVQNLLNYNVFRHLHATNPQVFKKVIGISGDILLPGLGISIADKEVLINNVSVVFHGAASIKFNDTLKYATQMNVVGTMKVVELCKQMRKLKVLVHISTAYSNCNRKEIKEEIYPGSLEPHRLLSLTDWIDEHVLETISLKLVGDLITTYHLTKSITEKILEKESQQLPIIIVRPSVVVGAWKEPIPGWTETLYHINGILVGAGRGVLRVLHCNPDSIVDIVPVDIVINLLIAVPWSKAFEKTNDVTVFNCVSGVDRPLTYRQLRDYSLPTFRTQPLLYPVWYPYLSLVKYKFIASFLMLFLHWLPALIADNALRLVGMAPRLGKVIRRIERSQSSSEFFLNNDFEFSNKNVKSLWERLSPADQEIFYFDMSKLPWKQYLEGYFLGCKQFVVKEDLSTLPRARSQMRRMKWIYHFLSWLVIIPVICILGTGCVQFINEQSH